jgi:hypothetical protein
LQNRQPQPKIGHRYGFISLSWSDRFGAKPLFQGDRDRLNSATPESCLTHFLTARNIVEVRLLHR